MKAIARRLRQLEARLESPDDPELRDLIRRRCEKTGHPYAGPSPEFAGLSLTEVARARLRRMNEGQQQPSLVAPSGTGRQSR